MKTKNRLMTCALLGAAAVFGQEPVALYVLGDVEPAYQAVLTRLKMDGLDIASASKDAGIQTGITVTGGFWQTGCYYKITFIPEGDKTTVRIVAYEMKRVKGVAGWTGAKENIERSRAEAFQLQRELGW